jgi:hypothetical protein
MNNLNNLDDSFQGKNIDLITINDPPQFMNNDKNNRKNINVLNIILLKTF